MTFLEYINWYSEEEGIPLEGITDIQLPVGVADLNGITQLKKIISLTAIFTSISDIDNVTFPDSLRSFDLTGTQISSLDNVKLPNSLQMLNLSGTQISSLDNVTFPTSLQMLNLSSTQISSLDNVTFPTSLQMLNLSSTQVSSLDNIKLPNFLRQLNLRGMPICCLDNVTFPDSLQELDLRGTSICSLDNVTFPTSLQELSLDDTPISSIDNVTFPTSLQLLYLIGTQISSIDNVIFPNLQKLYLSGTPISSIYNVTFPDSLQVLNLSDTQISNTDNVTLPTCVQELNLDYTPIDCISSLLAQRKPLFCINYSSYFSNRMRISIQGSFHSLEHDILLMNNETTQQYLKDTCGEKADSAYCREARIILLGSGEAGKTSLIDTFNGCYQRGKPATPGIEVSDYDLQIDAENYQLHFWDLGGQEIYHPLHALFMSQNSIYIIVLNGRNDEKPDEWLQYVDTYAPDSHVILVINKLDDNPYADINSSLYLKKYPNIYNRVFKISCDKPEKGTSQPRDIIEAVRKIIEGNKSKFSKLWPRKWLDVREKITTEYRNGKHYFDQREFDEICTACAVEDDQLIRDCIRNTLDTFGVALSFRENYQVLNPNWVLEGVYQTLKCRGQLEGIFLSKRHFDEILDQLPNHRKNYHKTAILEMLSSRDLCSKVDEDNIFFPALLPAERPEIEIDANEVYDFYFPFLPPFVLQKLMVMRWQDIQSNQGIAWRYGFSFQYDDSIVLVEEEKNRIRISIQTQNDGFIPWYLTLVRDQMAQIAAKNHLNGMEEIIEFHGMDGTDYLHYTTLLKLYHKNIQTYHLPSTLAEINVRSLRHKYLKMQDDKTLIKEILRLEENAKQKEFYESELKRLEEKKMKNGGNTTNNYYDSTVQVNHDTTGSVQNVYNGASINQLIQLQKLMQDQANEESKQVMAEMMNLLKSGKLEKDQKESWWTKFTSALSVAADGTTVIAAAAPLFMKIFELI